MPSLGSSLAAIVLGALAGVACLAIDCPAAYAALACSDVAPGAQRGNVVPAGEFNNAIQLPVASDACFVEWPANNRGAAGRAADQQKCNSLPNAKVLDYLPDHGSNFNLCVFQIVQANGSSTGASSPGPDSPSDKCDPTTQQCFGPCGSADEAKAKINVDWVFADKGAKITYGQHRDMGESCFDAVVSAQGHNPPVQRLLRQCQAWTFSYLSQLGKCGGECTLGDSRLGPQQCQCISVKPTGDVDNTNTPIYKVTNSCSEGMRVSVAFIDTATAAPASTSEARLVCPPNSFTVRPPQTYRAPSIVAYGIQNAVGAFTCVCRDGICN